MASFVLIIVVSGVLFYAQNNQIDELRAKLSQSEFKLDAKIASLDNKINSETSGIRGEIAKSGEELDEVRKDLTTVEEETDKKLGEVKQNLEDEITGLETNLAGDFSDVIKVALEATVSVLTDKGAGSGVIISIDGKTVTNAHVISGASQIGIKTKDGQIYLAEIIGVDDTADIAVLKPVVVDQIFDSMRWGDSDDLEVGQRVVALGNPFGLDFTATQGIVSALNRQAQNGLKYIQIDTPINPGNSGGPLINDEGRIVGINNWKVGGGEGLGFSIPANTAEDVVDDIS
jgi:S1-C subfamily serine protease